MRPLALAHATPIPWGPSLQHPRYGTDKTYRLAAAWLKDCASVADWGGSRGYLRTFLAPSVRYTLVDGTQQGPTQVLADLAEYHEPSDGIVLRHVLDLCDDWCRVLTNALQAARQRLVVVTYTPAVARSASMKLKSGWPVWHFNPDDLRTVMGRQLVGDVTVPTSHPEHVYYLEAGR